MIAVIDESGCPGFKLTKGSTPYFIIGMVCFTDLQEAEKTSRTIANLRADLNIKDEFKFNKTHPYVKDKFFKTVCRHEFKIRALAVDKKHVYRPNLRIEKEGFYNYFIKQLMQHDKTILQDAMVKIDGCGSKQLHTYLRQTMNGGKIKKLKFVDSKNDSLIQLADMVVGAIARSYSTKEDKWRWRQMLDKKIENIWDYIY